MTPTARRRRTRWLYPAGELMLEDRAGEFRPVVLGRAGGGRKRRLSLPRLVGGVPGEAGGGGQRRLSLPRLVGGGPGEAGGGGERGGCLAPAWSGRLVGGVPGEAGGGGERGLLDLPRRAGRRGTATSATSHGDRANRWSSAR